MKKMHSLLLIACFLQAFFLDNPAHAATANPPITYYLQFEDLAQCNANMTVDCEAKSESYCGNPNQYSNVTCALHEPPSTGAYGSCYIDCYIM
jgi:hypothetical protein